ncbi:MAG TPA: hypothetical protein PLO63_16935 [Syntrophales bacterium]|nr:hypothetical protein [Syntrophales bacterium]
MTAKLIIEGLRSLGYDLSVAGSKVRANYKGQGEPDPIRAAPLIRALKENKQQVLEHLRVVGSNECVWVNPFRQGSVEAARSSLLIVMDSSMLSARDRVVGGYRGSSFRVNDITSQAERRIEELQGRVVTGEASLAEFREAVDEWEASCMQARGAISESKKKEAK